MRIAKSPPLGHRRSITAQLAQGNRPSNLGHVAITTAEARQQILDDLAAALDQLGLAVACLSEAFEQLAVDAADRLEADLYRPVRKAYGRGKRTHAQFAQRVGLGGDTFEPPSAGPRSQGVKELVQKMAAALADADRRIAELQDSMLPIEAGDEELRAGLNETREVLKPVPRAAAMFLRTLGR